MKSSLQMCLKHLDDHWKVIEQLESFEQVGISSTNLGFLPFHQTVFLESTSLLEAKNTSLVFREAFKRAVLSLKSPYEAQRNWDIEICFKDLMDNALVPSQHLNHAPDHIRDGDASVCYHWFVDTDGLEVDTEVWNQAEHVSVNPLKQFFSGRHHVGLVKLMKKTARSQQHFSKCHLVHLLQPNMEIFDYDFSPASRERVLDLYLQRATHYETDEPQVKVGVSVLWSGTNSFFSLVDEEGLVRKMLGTHSLQNSPKTQFCRRFWSQQKPSVTSIPANLLRFYRPECTSKKQRNRNSNFHYLSKPNSKKSLRKSPPLRSPPFVGRSSFSTTTNLGLYAVGWKRMNAVLLLMELEMTHKAVLIMHSAVPKPTDLRA